MKKEVENDTQNNKDDGNTLYKEEFKNLDYLSLDCPVYLSMLDKLTFQIVYINICENCINEEEAKSIVKAIEDSNGQCNYDYLFKWEKFSLGNLFKADYNYLFENNIINEKLVPNEDFFRRPFYYADIPEMIYPHTAYEYYLIFLKKKIDMQIKYYFENIKNIKNKKT